jgi:ATP-binding cassette subfamily B protein
MREPSSLEAADGGMRSRVAETLSVDDSVTSSKPGEPSDTTLYRRLLQVARPFWLNVAAIFLLGLLATPLALLTPVPLAIAVDSVLGNQPLPPFLTAILPPTVADSDAALLVFAAVLVIAVAILTELQVLASLLLQTYTGEKLTLNFRSALFRQSQRLSLSYHDTKGTADSMYRIQYDTNAVSYVTLEGIVPLITATITLGAMIYVMYSLDPALAIIALAISPLLFAVTRLYRGRLRKQSKQVRRQESAALSVVQEVLSSLRVVKAFGQEEREQERFEDQSDQSLKARMRYTGATGAAGLLLGLTIATGTALVLYIGVRHVQDGVITLGVLLLIMGYLAQLYGPLKIIGRKVTSLQGHLASAERAFKLLDAPADVPEKENAVSVKRVRGVVSFKDVSFGYDGKEETLKDVSFMVSPGTLVGIAGETGAGKSTLVSLLMRFYDPSEGRILLDGTDLRDYVLSDLRNQFAMVLQETILFSTSIGENIAYARPEAKESEIVEASRAANIHDFIASLPDGYDTQVGERGMMLSGGERQRIALARAFLKNAPILILDEPTSSVDVKTEAGIMEAMERLMRGRTTFMIAHRLSTLEKCDVLLTIEDGQVKPVLWNIGAELKRAQPSSVSDNGKDSGSGATEGIDQKKRVRKRAGRPLEIDWQESEEELRELHLQEQNAHRRERLRALLLLQSGNSLVEVSESENIGYRTLKRWVAWYRTGGLEEVLSRTPGSGAVSPVARKGD